MTKETLLLEQYKQHIETYKFYLDLIVKIMTFHFAVTGAIVSYYLTNISIPHLKWSLLLPLVMSAGLLAFFSKGAALSTVTKEDVYKIVGKLELEVAPELGVLTFLLIVFAVCLFLITIGLAYLLFCAKLS